MKYFCYIYLMNKQKIKTTKRISKNGKPYWNNVYLCKHCNKEIYTSAAKAKTSKLECRECNDKYNKNGLVLKNRICTCCNIEQHINQFVSKNNKYSKKVCNKCINLKKYNINYKQYLNILRLQNNFCAICQKEETVQHSNRDKELSLSVDHCHETGKIRGLLCNKCNRGLGYFKDNIKLLENSIKYLQA